MATDPSHTSAHDAEADARNDDLRLYVNGRIVHRSEAVVSVYDAGFMLGDGVWEGLRLHNGNWAFLGEHLDRLFEAAKAIDLEIGMTREGLKDALDATAAANAMRDNAHARLMVTRGVKAQDPKLNSHSKLNCILAGIHAIKAGADEALMLDPHGFVNTTNSCNFFIVRKGEVWTSTGDYCMNGITRKKVIEVCRAAGIPVLERNFSLVDTYGADEAFVTGTFGGQTRVAEIDGRAIGGDATGPVTRSIQGLYKALVGRDTA